MNRNIFIGFLLLIISVVTTLLFICEKVNAQASQWSKGAIFLSYEKGVRHIEATSPDKKKTAIIDGVNLFVVMEGKNLQGIEDVGVNTIAELLWSPDSTSFAITESYGGEVGDWHITVYQIGNSCVLKLNVTNEAVSSFEKHYQCIEPEEPNVGAIRWLNEGKYLLLATEVPPHSSCPEMSKMRGYIVEISTGRVVQEMDEKELMADHELVRHVGENVE